MVLLADLNEPSILHNLRLRYNKDTIYVREKVVDQELLCYNSIPFREETTSRFFTKRNGIVT